jgi:L-fucose mutarotase
MLKGIDPLLGPELLHLLARAGHGDMLALVDRNYPAYSAGIPVTRVDGVDSTTLAMAMLTLFPIDGFVPDPVRGMEPDDGPRPASHQEMERVLRQSEGRDVPVVSLERHAFYQLARSAVGVIATSDDRPYSCFLLAKGVV